MESSETHEQAEQNSEIQIDKTFLQNFLSQPRVILENIFRYLTVTDFYRIEEAIGNSNCTLFQYQHVMVYQPLEIVVTQSDFYFESDSEGYKMSIEQFIKTNFQVNARLIRFQENNRRQIEKLLFDWKYAFRYSQRDLLDRLDALKFTDSNVENLLLKFDNRIKASHLYLRERYKMTTEIFAMLLRSLQIEHLSVGSTLNNEFLNLSVMKQIKSLRLAGNFCFEDEDTDFIFKNKFTVFSCHFEPPIPLLIFHNILLEWNKNEREITKIQVFGAESIDNVSNLFGDWKVVKEGEDSQLAQENLYPLVQSISWSRNDEILYKMTRKDQKVIYIRVVDATLSEYIDPYVIIGIDYPEDNEKVCANYFEDIEYFKKNNELC